MKFVYEYRTSDNVPHRGTISASNKEAAYDTLKAQGIKPGKVWEAPGFFNKVFGKGKRWLAIAVLLVALGGTATILYFTMKDAESVNKELEDITLYEDRGQIYGPASVLRDMEANEFAGVFDSELDRFLATYAIPAKVMENRKVVIPTDFKRAELARPVVINDADLDEVKKLKRMVNKMRVELRQYLQDGGTLSSYAHRLEIRQKAEYRIFESEKRALLKENDISVWKERNAMLRAKGLPMVDRPSEEK